MGCTLAFKKEDGSFVCPCHGARFDRLGAVQRGPAKADLFCFSIEEDAQGQLVVDKTKTISCSNKSKF
ncbi:MAG: Rieske (2Fe-2S) protein [Candidatus Omnitrophota bacterium]